MKPTMGSIKKIQLYQTPDSNWGIPGMMSKIDVMAAKIEIKATLLEPIVRSSPAVDHFSEMFNLLKTHTSIG